jgi:hypothetical protein
MSVREVYMMGASKAGLNRQLAKGEDLVCKEYTIAGATALMFSELPEGTIIKVYSKIVGGNPYARAYGSKRRGKIL